MSKCVLQLACMRSKSLKAPLPLCGLCMIMVYGRGQITPPGRFPYSFREACEFFKVPRIGLVKIERLGQRLNVPIQGRRVAQTGDVRPFSLTTPGSDPQPRIEPEPHWWETDALPIGHLTTHLYTLFGWVVAFGVCSTAVLPFTFLWHLHWRNHEFSKEFTDKKMAIVALSRISCVCLRFGFHRMRAFYRWFSSLIIPDSRSRIPCSSKNPYLG